MRHFSFWGSAILLAGLWTGSAAADDVVTESATGRINWSEGVVYAQGFGTAKPDLPEGQRRILSRRAAMVDGQRNLLEMTKGVRLTSMTKVVDMMVANETTATRVEGVVKGAAPVKESYQNDIYTVTMAMPIGGGLLGAVYEPGTREYAVTPAGEWRRRLVLRLEPYYNSLERRLVGSLNAAESFTIKSDAEATSARKILEWIEAENPGDVAAELEASLAEFQSGSFSGLLIDASAVPGFELATIPKIRDEEGTIIYPNPNVSYDDIVNKRGVSYDFDLDDAISNHRVAKVPFIVKAKSTYADLPSDLIIPKGDAKRILSSASTLNAMNRAGVMIVVAL